MLNAVLAKLTDCIEKHNEYAVKGIASGISNYVSKCTILLECLENAGYNHKTISEYVTVKEGVYVGCKWPIYVSTELDVSNATAEERNIFLRAGFNVDGNTATYVAAYTFNELAKEKNV